MRGVVAGVIAALCCGAAQADDAPVDAPTVLYFSGAEGWSAGSFGHAGLLWSPAGLDREGFVVKLVAGGGVYRYFAGALGSDVRVLQASASLMPGWRWKAGTLEVAAYLGGDVQHHAPELFDPDHPLRGTHVGLRAGADLWWEPMRGWMVAANASATSVGPGYWTRLAAGWRWFDMFWAGPEAQMLGGPTYTHARFGLHMTSLRTGAYEWSAGVGYHTEQDGRDGLYGRLGLLVRR